MGKKVFGAILLAVALFMLIGFFKAGPKGGAAFILTFLIAVVLPAAGGIYLFRSAAAEGAGLAERKERLRRQTLEAELLRLAGRRGGRLTVAEAAAETAFDALTVEESLKKMAIDGLAEVKISESGVLVYSFYELEHQDEKAGARGVLDV